MACEALATGLRACSEPAAEVVIAGWADEGTAAWGKDKCLTDVILVEYGS